MEAASSTSRVVQRSEIVNAARQWVGTPYLHQASLKCVGCDCLGLLRGVWREFYGDEPENPPPYAPDWAEITKGEPMLEAATRYLVPPASQEQLLPGMVIFFRWRVDVAVKHCGIIINQTSFIHAHDGAMVAEVSLIPAWRRRIAAIFDFPNII